MKLLIAKQPHGSSSVCRCVSVKLKAKLAQTLDETIKESANQAGFHHPGVITSEAGAFAG